MPITMTNDIPPPTIMGLSIVHIVVFLVSSVGYGLSVFMHFIASLLPHSRPEIPSIDQILRARREGVAKHQVANTVMEKPLEGARTRHISPADCSLVADSWPDRPRNASMSSSVRSRSSSADTFVTSASVPMVSPIHNVTELPGLESHSGSLLSADDEVQNSTSVSSPSSLGSYSRGRPSVSRRITTFKVFKLKPRRVSDTSIPEEPDMSLSSPGSDSVPSSPPQQQYRTVTFIDSERRPVDLASPTGETFKSYFANPFKRKPKGSKSRSPPPPMEPLAEEQLSPSRRRFFRRPTFLNSLHLTLSPPPLPSSSKHTRHDSTSSVCTFASRSSAGSPRNVARTQPYAAPYFARMPTEVDEPAPRRPRQGELRSQKESSKSDSETHAAADPTAPKAPEARRKHRRVSAPATSIQPTNCLGLTLEGEAGGASSRPRHRATMSEGAAMEMRKNS